MSIKKSLLSVVAGTSLLLGGSGCVHYTIPRHRAAEPMPREIREHYDYPRVDAKTCHIHELEFKENRKYYFKTLDIEVSDSKKIAFDHFDVKRKQKDSLAFILPIAGGEDYRAEHYIAKRLAKKYGISSITMHRPQIGEDVDSDSIEKMLRESIIDARTLLDWARQQEDIDKEKMGLLGISLGSMRAVILYALEQENLKGAVLGLGGRDISYILTYSSDGALRGKGISRRRKDFLKKSQMSLEEMEKSLDETIRTDPKYFSKYIESDNLLEIVAMCDQVIPSKKQLALRKDLGNPETIFLPTGHYTAAMYFPYIMGQTALFFQRVFNEDEEHGIRRQYLFEHR